MLCVPIICGCQVNAPSQIPETVYDLPIFPGAQDINITHGDNNDQTVTYRALAQPSEICEFYRTTLARDYWRIPSCSAEDPLNATFEWTQTDQNGPTSVGFRLYLTASELKSGQSNVTLDLSSYDPQYP